MSGLNKPNLLCDLTPDPDPSPSPIPIPIPIPDPNPNPNLTPFPHQACTSTPYNVLSAFKAPVAQAFRIVDTPTDLGGILSSVVPKGTLVRHTTHTPRQRVTCLSHIGPGTCQPSAQ